MGRKKLPEEHTDELVQKVVEAQPKQLTAEEMLKMQLYEEETVAGNAVAQLQIMLKDNYLRQIDPEGKLTVFVREIRAATEKSASAKKKAEDIKLTIEKRLGISLKEYAYSDETGLLQKVDQ